MIAERSDRGVGSCDQLHTHFRKRPASEDHYLKEWETRIIPCGIGCVISFEIVPSMIYDPDASECPVFRSPSI